MLVHWSVFTLLILLIYKVATFILFVYNMEKNNILQTNSFADLLVQFAYFVKEKCPHFLRALQKHKQEFRENHKVT